MAEENRFKERYKVGDTPWDIGNGERTLFAYGYVKYRDVFGGYHETGFCWYYFVPQGGMITFAKEGWRPYLQAPPAYKKAT
jgi:hypothetical protein